jgi:hypothetical protein
MGIYLMKTGAFPLPRAVIWFVPPIASARYLDTTMGTESQGKTESANAMAKVGMSDDAVESRGNALSATTLAFRHPDLDNSPPTD